MIYLFLQMFICLLLVFEKNKFREKNCKNVIKPFGRDRDNKDLHMPFNYPMSVWRMMSMKNILLLNKTVSFFEYNRKPLNERAPTNNRRFVDDREFLDGTDFLDDEKFLDGIPPWDVKEFWENMVPWDNDNKELIDEVELWEAKENQNNFFEINSGVEDI